MFSSLYYTKRSCFGVQTVCTVEKQLEALRLLSYSCRYPGYQTNFLVCGEMLRHIFDRRPKRPKEKKTPKFRVGSLYKDLVARSSVICTRGSFSLGT